MMNYRGRTYQLISMTGMKNCKRLFILLPLRTFQTMKTTLQLHTIFLISCIFFKISVIPNIMLYVKIEGNMIQKTPCEFCGTTYFAPKSSAILIYEALYTFFKPLVFVPKR